MSSSVFVVLVASIVVGQTEENQFTEWANAFAGQWIAESTVDFDLEGVCKKGDKAITRISRERTLNGRAVIEKVAWEINGKNIGQALQLAGWDRAKQRVIASGFNSMGGSGRSEWTKTPDGWRETANGNLPDGRVIGFVNKYKLSEDGNSGSAEVVDRIIGQERLPNLTIVYRRTENR